jgi:uncharacterized protein YwqG
MSSLEEYARLNTRTASIVHIGGFRPTGDPLASHFGLAPVGLPNEQWPSYEGQPLMLVCQLNLTAAPFVPQLLSDIALITFFAASETPESKENGVDWHLRAYKSVDGLVPMTVPPDAPRFYRGFECRWEECTDQPVYDDPEIEVPAGFDRVGVHLDNVRRTKIGGYASNIQCEPWWADQHHPANPRFCLQIASEEKVGLMWGDCGAVYIARGTALGREDEWFLDWQCY